MKMYMKAPETIALSFPLETVPKSLVKGMDDFEN